MIGIVIAGLVGFLLLVPFLVLVRDVAVLALEVRQQRCPGLTVLKMLDVIGEGVG